MHRFIGTNLGKAVRGLTNLRGTGGQALPGLVVERLLPRYLASMLAQLPKGVVVITGTNGKTTTTKMVVELLRAQHLRVLSNPTGSNFTRGIISSLTQQARHSGKLPFDIGVFELDEAHARHFVAQVKPAWAMGLNVMRDQLDRFGEVDAAARMIGDTLAQATQGVVVNADDRRLSDLASKLSVEVVGFGVDASLRQLFPSDDEIVAVTTDPRPIAPRQIKPAVELAQFQAQNVTFRSRKKTATAHLQLTGQYNFQNAAAALALVASLLPEVEFETLVHSLASVSPAFGRGEHFILKDGSRLELILVKNPAGFRQALASYPVAERSVMMAVNDNYPDGRDVSWLWDVDFSMLQGQTIPLTSGTRAADMALRLHYDDCAVQTIQPNLDDALQKFCAAKGDKLLITTYTAMLHFHAQLQKNAGKTL